MMRVQESVGCAASASERFRPSRSPCHALAPSVARLPRLAPMQAPGARLPVWGGRADGIRPRIRPLSLFLPAPPPFPTLSPFSPLSQLVELKNGETYNGTLVTVDAWMNVHLTDCICTSKVKRERERRKREAEERGGKS